MHITADIAAMRRQRWATPAATWGFVPTMGYLHDGHLALLHRARAENEFVAASIYVNPTQFAPDEDLSTYPRNMARDTALLREAGVDLLFTPSDATMYPAGFQTAVQVQKVSQPLEGASRPTHFAGVALVVAKLFNIIQPTRAYFGQKDAQQVAVLQRMVRDLNFNLELRVCPIVREPDGLALSSRNKYLSAAEREAAVVLNRALHEAQTAVAQGQRHAAPLRQQMRRRIEAEPLAKIDYVSVANAITLQELDGELADATLLLLAVFFGRTRLIDNVRVQPLAARR